MFNGSIELKTQNSLFSTTLLSLRTITRRCQKSRFFTCSNGFSAVFPPVSKIRVSFFALRSRFLSRFQWFPPRTLQTFFEFSSKRRLPSCRSAPFATVVWSQPSVLSVNSVGCLCVNAAKEPLPKSILWQAATLRTGQRMPLRLSQGRNRSQRRSSCSAERALRRWTRRARRSRRTHRSIPCFRRSCRIRTIRTRFCPLDGALRCCPTGGGTSSIRCCGCRRGPSRKRSGATTVRWGSRSISIRMERRLCSMPSWGRLWGMRRGECLSRSVLVVSMIVRTSKRWSVRRVTRLFDHFCVFVRKQRSIVWEGIVKRDWDHLGTCL